MAYWIFNYVYLIFRSIFKPYVVTNVHISSLSFKKENKMKFAVVKVSWEPSVSADVVEQFVLVTNETTHEEILDTVLSPIATDVTFNVPEKTTVSVSVSVSDGTFESDAVVLTFQVGDLSIPQPVSGLKWEILEVLDSND